MNPPAKESPAPVGIVDGLQRERAVLKNSPSRPKSRQPCSPFFTATYCGPSFAMARPARMRLSSSVSWRASLSLRMSMSTSRSRASRSCRARPIHRSIVSATTNFGRRTCSTTRRCSEGRDVAEQHVGRLAVMLGQLGLERLEDVELDRKRLAVVHVLLVLAGPAEGLARRDLQAVKVDPALGEKGRGAARGNRRRRRRQASPDRKSWPRPRHRRPSRRGAARAPRWGVLM